MESVKIAVDNPAIEFVVDSVALASFKFFDLEQVIEDAHKSGADDLTKTVADWMYKNGLPSSINLVTVDKWLVAYMAYMAAEQKKMIGQ